MKYVIIGIILIVLLIVVLIYPFKVTIFNNENYLYINISQFVNLKVNLLSLIEKGINSDLKKKAEGFKMIKNLKIKDIDLKVSGLNFDYRINGAYFGLLYGIFGFLDKICQINSVDLNYDFKYYGDKSIEFKSVIRARVWRVLKVYSGI